MIKVQAESHEGNRPTEEASRGARNLVRGLPNAREIDRPDLDLPEGRAKGTVRDPRAVIDR